MKIIHRPMLLVFFLAVGGYALYQSIYSPYHNWDMIMYVASAKYYEQRDMKSLHDFTYDAVRRSVSEPHYQYLTQGHYRQAIHTDVSAFSEQFPFYQIRPLYTGAIYLFYKAGVNIVLATHIISAISVMLALILLYFMSAIFLTRPLSFAIPFLALIFAIPELAIFSTPDGMAFLAVIIASYFYLRKHIIPLLITLPLMLCVRTDLALFVFPLLFFLLVMEKPLRRQTGVSIIISVITYIAVNVYWANPGWVTTFYFTFVQLLTHPLSMPSPLTIRQYFDTLSFGFRPSSAFWAYSLICAYSLYFIACRIKTQSLSCVFSEPPVVLSLVCMIFVISHFVLFPMMTTRFFAAPYLLSAFAFLSMMQERCQDNTMVTLAPVAQLDRASPS